MKRKILILSKNLSKSLGRNAKILGDLASARSPILCSQNIL